MVYANFGTVAFEGNIIFDLGHVLNRDNCFQPFWLMREKFQVKGIEINTTDINVGKSTIFDLQMDVQKKSAAPICYLLMLETKQVFPANGVASNWDRYKRIFTWNDALVDGDRFIKINFPNYIRIGPVDGYSSRNRFCCMIAGNKSLAASDDSNLYPERVKVIRWFENNAPADFDLYGVGWDRPLMQRGVTGKIERLVWTFAGQYVCRRPFPSYRGKIERKSVALAQTRFSICYENVRDLPGYITEKIFDCFFSGSVPVYWGARNITDHIPADCFIDRRSFESIESVYRFLKAMREDEFIGYQQRIAKFLQSDAAYLFGSEYFTETIVNTIVQDLGNLS